MLQSLIEYQRIKASIPRLMEVSGFRNDYLANKLGIKPGTFNVKKQRSTWTDSEVIKLVEFFIKPNVEVMDILDIEKIDSHITTDRMTSEEFKSRLTWK